MTQNNEIGHRYKKVLVCGGRDFSDYEFLAEKLDGIDPDIVISGMARGADTLAAEWALRRGKQLMRFYAEWDKHGKAAGFIRNQRMLDEGQPDLVVAFPGGRGTADMIRRADKAGVDSMQFLFDD